MRRYLNACKAEWIKVFSTRSWWVLGLVMMVFIAFTAALLSVAMTEFLGMDTGGVTQIPVVSAYYSLGSAMGYLFPVLLGALAVTTEYRNHTITPTFLSVGRRSDVLTAKVTVQGLMGALYGLAALVAAVLASVFFIIAQGMPTELGLGATWLMFGRSLIAMGLWAVLGVGLGALIRSQAGAIVLVIVFTQFIEPVLRLVGGFAPQAASAVKFLPGAVSDAFVGQTIYTLMAADAGGEVLVWWQAGLMLALYAAVAVVAAGLTRWRGDVT